MEIPTLYMYMFIKWDFFEYLLNSLQNDSVMLIFMVALESVCRAVDVELGCALFKSFGHNTVLNIDRSQWLSTTMPSFLKLDNVYPCFWAILDKYISHVSVTKTIYFVRYCNRQNSTENRLETKVNVVQIQKLDILVLSLLRSIKQDCASKTFKKGRTLL